MIIGRVSNAPAYASWGGDTVSSVTVTRSLQVSTDDAWTTMMNMQAAVSGRASRAHTPSFDSIFRPKRQAGFPAHCNCAPQPKCEPGPPGPPGPPGHDGRKHYYILARRRPGKTDTDVSFFEYINIVRRILIYPSLSTTNVRLI